MRQNRRLGRIVDDINAPTLVRITDFKTCSRGYRGKEMNDSG